MIRTTAVILFVLFFSVRAYRDWFTSLCATILLMAVVQHPDFPRTIGGIQGLNPWNVLLGNVMLAWWIDRKKRARALDLPRSMATHLTVVFAIFAVNTLRLYADPGIVGQERTMGYMLSEYGINTFKWVVPGLLLFDGCRTQKRFHVGLLAILLLYLFLSLQIIRWMPFGVAISGGDDMARRASKIIENEVGYNRVTISNVLAGASWAALSTLVLVRTWKARIAISFGSGLIILGQALTGGRTGYASWFLVGMMLAAIKWRKLLLIVPVAGLIVISTMPGVRDRLFQGIGGRQGNVQIASDDYEITSGRTLIWPYVIKEIYKSPVIGHGRQAMVTTGLRDYLWQEFEEGFPHPHNAYLEVLIDGGIISFIGIVSFFIRIQFLAFRTLLTEEPLFIAIGAGVFAIVTALLLGSIGGQTFYPREAAVGMWCMIGLLLRAHVARTSTPFEADTAETVYPWERSARPA